MKTHGWIFWVVLAGCAQEADCGTQYSNYCLNGTGGTLISGPPGASPCECPNTGDASEVANQRCGITELVCRVGGRDCSCLNGIWSCDGFERDLAIDERD
jgi:hypothetical protein